MRQPVALPFCRRLSAIVALVPVLNLADIKLFAVTFLSGVVDRADNFL